ncbi:MAG: HNH endonuclease, partial [Cyanobacteria bacterium P01_E01_bin.42]
RRLSGIIRETFFHRVVGLDNSILFGDVCQVPFSTRFSACLSPLERDRWCFATHNQSNNPLKLANHADTKIVRHTKVAGCASPMDGNLIYWSSRMGKHPQMPRSKAFLLKRQKGKCNRCGLYFCEGDRLELDHILPQSKGGRNRRDNLQLLHQHCHHEKTRDDKTLVKVGTHDKGCITEEPDEVKVSSPVLKTSRVSDLPA